MLESLSLLAFTTLMLLGSPGPATLTLAAVGATSGFSRGLPFLYGILVGLVACITGAGLGIALVFEAYPELKITVQLLGAAYLLWLAYRIATSPIANAAKAPGAALGFRDGFVLNLLNPKAYAAFFALFGQFLLPFESAWVAYVATGALCFSVAVVIDVIWLWAGAALRAFLSDTGQSKVTRLIFAASIVIATAIALFS